MDHLFVHRVRRDQISGKEVLDRLECPLMDQVVEFVRELDDDMFPAVFLGRTDDPWTDQSAICIVGRFEYWHVFSHNGNWRLDTGTGDNTEERFWDACEIFCARKNVTKRIENIRSIIARYSTELTPQNLDTIFYLPDDPLPPAACDGQLSLFDDADDDSG